MDNKVKSFRDAIKVTLEKLKYDEKNIYAIKKLITNALEKNLTVFNDKNANNYIKEKGTAGILEEMLRSVKIRSNDPNIIIDQYIDNKFINNNIDEIIENIKENSDLAKVNKKIRYLNTISESDSDFEKRRWDYFSKAFIGEDEFISKQELRNDMLYAALQESYGNRDNASVLKTLDPMSMKMTKMDAVNIVEEYIYSDKLDELNEYINANKVLSGSLLKNLFDYTYFEIDKPKKHHLNLDMALMNIKDLKYKAHIVNELLIGKDTELEISREQAIVDVLKNTLGLSIYSNYKNKESLDYEEKRLYVGDDNKDEEIIRNRINKNNEIAGNLLINGTDTKLEDLASIINNLTDKEMNFLANIYVISRSLNDNVTKIDSSIYYGNNNQIHIYNLLDDSRLLDKLTKEEVKGRVA